MINKFEEQILGRVEVGTLSAGISKLIEDTYSDGPKSKSDIKILFNASDRIFRNLPKEPTVADILKPAMFEEAVLSVAPDKDAMKIRRLASLLFEYYAYVITVKRTDALQKDVSNEDYEKIAAAAAEAQEDIDTYILESVGKMMRTVCPDIRGSLSPNEKAITKTYFSDARE